MILTAIIISFTHIHDYTFRKFSLYTTFLGHKSANMYITKTKYVIENIWVTKTKHYAHYILSTKMVNLNP